MGSFPQLPMPPVNRQPNIAPAQPMMPRMMGGGGGEYPYGQTAPYPYPKGLAIVDGINNFLNSFKAQKDQQKQQALQEAMQALQLRAQGVAVDDNKVANLLRKSGLPLDFTNPAVQQQPPIASGQMQAPQPIGQTANGPTSPTDPTAAFLMGTGLGQPPRDSSNINLPTRAYMEGAAPGTLPMDISRLSQAPMGDPGASPPMEAPMDQNAMMPSQMQQKPMPVPGRKPGLWDQVKQNVLGMYPDINPQSAGMEFIRSIKPNPMVKMIQDNAMQMQLMQQAVYMNAAKEYIQQGVIGPNTAAAMQMGLWTGKSSNISDLVFAASMAGSRDPVRDAGKISLNLTQLPMRQEQAKLAETLKHQYSDAADAYRAAGTLLSGEGIVPTADLKSFNAYLRVKDVLTQLSTKFPLMPSSELYAATGYAVAGNVDALARITQKYDTNDFIGTNLKRDEYNLDVKKLQATTALGYAGLKNAFEIAKMNGFVDVIKTSADVLKMENNEFLQMIANPKTTTDQRNEAYRQLVANAERFDGVFSIAGEKFNLSKEQLAKLLGGIMLITPQEEQGWTGDTRMTRRPMTAKDKEANRKVMEEFQSRGFFDLAPGGIPGQFGAIFGQLVSNEAFREQLSLAALRVISKDPSLRQIAAPQLPAPPQSPQQQR